MLSEPSLRTPRNVVKDVQLKLKTLVADILVNGLTPNKHYEHEALQGKLAGANGRYTEITPPPSSCLH